MLDNQELNEVQEDKEDKPPMIHIRLAPDTFTKFKATCALLNKSMTQCCSDIIENFLDENKTIPNV